MQELLADDAQERWVTLNWGMISFALTPGISIACHKRCALSRTLSGQKLMSGLKRPLKPARLRKTVPLILAGIICSGTGDFPTETNYGASLGFTFTFFSAAMADDGRGHGGGWGNSGGAGSSSQGGIGGSGGVDGGGSGNGRASYAPSSGGGSGSSSSSVSYDASRNMVKLDFKIGRGEHHDSLESAPHGPEPEPHRRHEHEYMACVKVVNMSFSGPRDELVAEAIEKLSKKGIVFVAAAGNEGPTAAPSYPAAYPQVIAVTAVTKDLHNYRYANRGDHIDVAAPGVNIWTAMPGGRAGCNSGTSFAAPHVTAILAVEPREMLQQDKANLLDGLPVIDLGQQGRDPVYGRGLLVAPSECTPPWETTASNE